MLDKEKIKIFFIITCILLMQQCISNIRMPYQYRIVINDQVAGEINVDDVKRYIPRKYLNPAGSNHPVAEIIIYKYSPGKDVFMFSDKSKNTIKIVQRMGFIEAMLKLKGAGGTTGISFIKAGGKSKGEMIKKLVSEINRNIGN